MTEPEPTALPFPEGLMFPPGSRLVGEQALELANPVRHGSEELPRLTLRALRAVHVRTFPKEDNWDRQEQFLQIAGLLTGLPDSVIDQVRGEDLGALTMRVGEMLWPVFDLPTSWLKRVPGEEPKLLDWPKIPAPFTLELERPLVSKQDEVSRLTFQSMTGKTARQCKTELPLRLFPWLVAELTREKRDLLDQLEGRDLNRALVVAQCFFVGSHARPTRP